MKKIISLLAILILVGACNGNEGGHKQTKKNTKCDTDSAETYQQKVQSIKQTELSQPTNFLKASGTYNQTLFGNSIKLHGIITNIANVANFKDVVIKVTFYSKTKAFLGNNNYVVHDFFPPHSEKPFELKIDKLDDTNTIEWVVVKATPN